MKLIIKYTKGKHIFIENDIPTGYFGRILTREKKLFNSQGSQISYSLLYIDFFTFKINNIFKWRYEIEFNNNKLAKAISDKRFFANYYDIQYKNNSYKVILHKNHRFSVFKDNIQIAYFKSSSFHIPFTKKTVCKAYADDDIDRIFFYSLILAHLTDLRGDTFEISFGRRFETKPFDAKWKPKKAN